MITEDRERTEDNFVNRDAARIAGVLCDEKLSYAERLFLASGCFVVDLRWGTVNFHFPSKEDISIKKLSFYDTDSLDENGLVEINVVGSEMDATDSGFYESETSIKVRTAGYKK